MWFFRPYYAPSLVYFRVLGGRAFGLHKNAENLPVQCYLITDETAKRLLSDAYYDMFVNFFSSF